MLENFPTYLRTYPDNHSSIFEELLQYRFTRKLIWSTNIIRYSFLLRYTSIQSYKALFKDFPLPSLWLLLKISRGTIDAVKCANALRIERCMSSFWWSVLTKKSGVFCKRNDRLWWQRRTVHGHSLLHVSRLERIDSICNKMIAWNQHWRQLAWNRTFRPPRNSF